MQKNLANLCVLLIELTLSLDAAEYSVVEGLGLFVCVELVSGETEREVTFDITLGGGSASGMCTTALKMCSRVMPKMMRVLCPFFSIENSPSFDTVCMLQHCFYPTKSYMQFLTHRPHNTLSCSNTGLFQGPHF